MVSPAHARLTWLLHRQLTTSLASKHPKTTTHPSRAPPFSCIHLDNMEAKLCVYPVIFPPFPSSDRPQKTPQSRRSQGNLLPRKYPNHYTINKGRPYHQNPRKSTRHTRVQCQVPAKWECCAFIQPSSAVYKR